MAKSTAVSPPSPQPVLSAQQISQRDQLRAFRLRHAQLGIEQAVAASAGKGWTPEQVMELADGFREMLDAANDPTP